ncbi:MAG: winged helix-turn-helix transcriptional regulator [Lachnospiraceae bacterium]|jgi:ArsR family transcriptional regulator|nr:winged helix-turn-helix transcriptional regulator [Lachnospiraceae bacterium]
MGFAETFKALSDPTRREILDLLKGGRPLTAGEIVDQFNMTGATISHHLSILKHAGLIDDEKKGKYIYYYLSSSVLDDVLNWILSLKEDLPSEIPEDPKNKKQKGETRNEK